MVAKGSFQKSMEKSIKSMRRDLSVKMWRGFNRRQSVRMIKKSVKMRNLGARFLKTAA